VKNQPQDPDSPAIYEIRLRGYLSTDWSPWFNDMSVTHNDEGQTLLTGLVVDQAALYGLLDKARDLGLSLLSVRQLTADDDRTDSRKG
jgi:hypothetical protein